MKKCKKDTFVFDGDYCIIKALEILSKVKGEEQKGKYKSVEYNIQLHAHNGSGFDRKIILNNLPCDKHIVDINKNRKGKVSSGSFNGYIQNNKKQIPQYLIFRCGNTHSNYSLKKLGRILNYRKKN